MNTRRKLWDHYEQLKQQLSGLQDVVSNPLEDLDPVAVENWSEEAKSFVLTVEMVFNLTEDYLQTSHQK